MAENLGTPYLRFERRGPVAWCTIDRPEARNALTSSMYFGIRKAVELVNRSDDLHALVLTGTGDVFAPGGEMGGRHNEGEEDVGSLLGSDVLPFRTLRHSAAPVISAVNGICQGGGLMIAMLSDIAVVSDRATFRVPELLRGVADSWYAAVLPVHVGVARARDLMLSARRFGAQEAVAMGLVARVVPHEELLACAQTAAEDILQTAPEARLQVKRLLNERYGEIDHVSFEQSIRSAECAEGFGAFVSKRSPNWIPAPLRRRKER